MANRRKARWTGAVICLPALIALALSATAGMDDTGFYFGGTATVLVLEGTGTWKGFDFDILQPLSAGSNGPIGLNWDERLLFGARPLVGYRFDSRFAVQAAYSYLLPKASAQYYTETDANSTYEQRMDIEWHQSSVEAYVAYYPARDWGAYFYCGADWVHISTDVIFSESLEYASGADEWLTDGQSSAYESSLSALGFLFGAGIELPAENLTFSPFFALQFSTAKTNERFFVSDDFQVEVGGFSFLGGLKWHFSSD